MPHRPGRERTLAGGLALQNDRSAVAAVPPDRVKRAHYFGFRAFQRLEEAAVVKQQEARDAGGSIVASRRFEDAFEIADADVARSGTQIDQLM